MNILSIQSWVAYGHVGNASAVFPLQRLGAEVWAINTVQFSNHTGYGHWTGQVYSGESVRELVDGIEARDVDRDYRFEQGFTLEMYMNEDSQKARDAFVEGGKAATF